MSRQQNQTQNFFPGKIRKRGCSSSASSTSSIVQNYRFKRAILIGKRGGGGGSATPVPTWRLMRTTPSSVLRAIDSQSEYGGFVNKAKQHQLQLQQQHQHSQQPVSARKLAATLWEMNEMPSPKLRETSGGGGGYDERRIRREARARERERERVTRSLHSGSLPPHLSDPSHSPVSEVETRSRAQTPSGSTVGVKTRLKDVSNALTTSKELLKIINRMWGQEDRPSSSMSLVSALHAELERARLQVNQLIQEQRSDQSEISYLMKCFAEEKAAWKNKEREVVGAAIESIAGELEVERKLRRRFESLNKKLGKELAETKHSLLKAVKDLDTEKRARVVIEQVCDELARDINDDKSEVEELKRESAIALEEVEKERGMMQVADVLREERAQIKLSEAKYQLEEKNAAVDKLRSQLEVFLGTKKAKEKGRSSVNQPTSEEIAAYLSRSHFGSNPTEENDDIDGEVEDGVEYEEDSAESDLHSIELNMDNNNKIYNWAYAPGAALDSRKVPFDEEEIKGRKSTSGKLSKRSTTLQRSISDGVDWGSQAERLQNAGDDLHWGRQSDLDKQAQVLGYGDEMHGYKSAKGLKDQLLSSSRIGASRVYASPTRPLRDHGNAAHERPPMVPAGVSKSRLSESRGESQNARKSRW
ncbi:myosin-9 isoform X2 [Citrus clementina]|uniref:myosin-9 isoform X2 n=1 Tax=Citrus clementina TaxID=85681 RepID=UPI000CED0AE5|nr:myosin-9 isoform X2 [Citrus x clementina]